MGKIFGKKKKEEDIIASPPESTETPGEIKEIERLNNQSKYTEEVVSPTDPEVNVNTTDPEVNYREIPVCMSQSQINNLIIENNIMLKQIISNMDD